MCHLLARFLLRSIGVEMSSRLPGIAWSLILLATLTLGACSGISVSSDWDPNADFSRIASWDWVPGPQGSTGNPRLDSDLLDQRIRSAVDAELSLRGVRRAREGNPDVLIAYHLGVENKIDVNTVQRSYGYGPYWYSGPAYTETYVSEYEQGTLLIDILQPEDRRLVWRGAGQARVNESGSPEDREARVREAVRKILEQFPPQK